MSKPGYSPSFCLHQRFRLRFVSAYFPRLCRGGDSADKPEGRTVDRLLGDVLG